MKRLLRRAAVRAILTILRPIYSGLGTIVCLHRVVDRSESFRISSNTALEISSKGLETLIQHVLARRFEVVTLDEVCTILQNRERRKKFVAFTFDDGYLDTLHTALPIFQKYGLPLTVNLTTDFVENPAKIWWYRLERVLIQRNSLTFQLGGEKRTLEALTSSQKNSAFDAIARVVRGMVKEHRDEFLNQLFNQNPVSGSDERLTMNWNEIRQLASDMRVTFGAHSVSHCDFNQMTDDQVLFEMNESRAIIQRQTGRKVEHFAYPFGGRNSVGSREFALAKCCGFKTALTLRNANLFPSHAANMECLPRISVSGNYPIRARFDLLQSGALAAFSYRFRRTITD